MKTNDKAQSEAPSVDSQLDELAVHLQLNMIQTMWLKTKINRLIEEAYKKGYVDGGIGVINGK